MRPCGQLVKTPPFHGGRPGSIPGRVTKKTRRRVKVKTETKTCPNCNKEYESLDFVSYNSGIKPMVTACPFCAKFDELKKLQGVKFSKNKPSKKLIKDAEESLGFSMGNMLERYLTECGHLEFGSVKIFGLSDLVQQTQSLRDQYSQLSGYVVIENRSEGHDFTLCNEKDEIFNFIPIISHNAKPTGSSLFEYFIKRYNDYGGDKSE